MDYRWLLNLFLAVFVTVGLGMAPLVTPAAVAQPYMGGMMDMSMSAEMPCCPDGQKSKDCQDCPLVAMCMLTIAQAEPSPTNSIQVSFQISGLYFALVDMFADGLAAAPPDHPPRILT
jgi:hypothetical protein